MYDLVGEVVNVVAEFIKIFICPIFVSGGVSSLLFLTSESSSALKLLDASICESYISTEFYYARPYKQNSNQDILVQDQGHQDTAWSLIMTENRR